MFDEVAPAMPFFLPKGAFVYNRMVQYVRDLYERDGYEEVITPQALRPEALSHERAPRPLQREHVPPVDRGPARRSRRPRSGGQVLKKGLQERAFALKPMNCPSHCVIFGTQARSYRELPWRVADFGAPAPLRARRRRARAGAGAELRAGRRAHLLRRGARSPAEIERFMRLLLRRLQGVPRSSRSTSSSRRAPPTSASAATRRGTAPRRRSRRGPRARGPAFELSPGEGAFYGPKIEFHVHDALKRSWQLGTIQYDPNLPERFELRFIGRGRQGAPPGHAAPRDLRVARALLRRVPRALRRELPDLARAAGRPSCSR